MIQLDHIVKQYTSAGRKEYVLQGLSMRVERGEFVAIMGPSGSGKSTLLQILGGLDRPCKGTYTFEGQRIESLSDRQLAAVRNEKIGFVFQNFQLIANLSVYQNVLLPLTYNEKTVRNKKSKVMTALTAVGMEQYAHKYPHQLSGGQKQRVSMARAIVNEPSFILADEPTGSLDEENSKKIMTILQLLHKQGTTIIMITHDKDVASVADRTLYLRYGKVEEYIHAIS